jgi:hypothetical protein
MAPVKARSRRPFANIFRPKCIGPLFSRQSRGVKALARCHKGASPPSLRRRNAQGVRSIQEIKRLQSNSGAEGFCIPQASFAAAVREITGECVQEIAELCGRRVPGIRVEGLRWEKDALITLQLVTENLMCMMFEIW